MPGAGGVQRAFGTDNKALQVGFAVQAGIRARSWRRTVRRPTRPRWTQWLGLVGGDRSRLDLDGPAVPGGLAIDVPCCYALQRPISALAGLATGVSPRAEVLRIVVRTLAGDGDPAHPSPAGDRPAGQVQPGVRAAVALLDRYPGLGSFTDAAVRRPAAGRLAELVEAVLAQGGTGLLDGDFTGRGR